MDVLLVLAAAFLVASVLASKASAKLGIPALVLFIALGMFAGSEGPGGIPFTDAALTQSIGTTALAFILFAGGLDSHWPAVKPILWRGIALSTIGVLASTGLVALFAHQFLGFDMLESLLLGAIVSSTDAAAVFGVLRTGNIQLKRRLVPLLEFESGTNDPMAVFLTVSLIGLSQNPERNPLALAPSFLLSMGVGSVVGIAVGHAAVWLINRINLEYDGLYPAITSAALFLAFGGAHLISGSGFLAVYILGLVMGSRTFLHKIGLVQFHDGVAWLMQITMFLALGLLVFPSQLLMVIGAGLSLSLFLILFARPVSVFLSLPLARKMKKRERLFVSWAGLRGAVPIILATFPLLAGIPKAGLIFNLVFFVVLTSVVFQGTTLVAVAKLLGVVLPDTHVTPDAALVGESNLVRVVLPEGSSLAGKRVVELGLPATALIVLLQRGKQPYIPRGATVLRVGDELLVATRKDDIDELRLFLEG